MRKSRPTIAGRVLVFALLALAAGMPASAQQSAAQPASAGSPASPETATVFVSRLKAEPVDYQVKLTWIDSPDLKGTCVVYRSAQEITTQSLARAQVIGSVSTGTGSYVDTPPDRSGWYYAVLIRDTAGNLYPILVPFRNKTSEPVSPQTSAPETQLAAQVTGIKAAPTGKGDIIQVSFSVSNRTRDLLLFWGPLPFNSTEDLVKATRALPLDPGTSSYVLAVLPGVDYWFAVLDAGMYKIGKAPLVKGGNTTAYPIQLQVTQSHGLPAVAPTSRRGIPLPFLSVDTGTGLGLAGTDVPGLPSPRPLSDAAQRALTSLQIDTDADPKPPKPEVLASDATPTPGGELGRLQDIVQGPFLGGDMAQAQQKLLDFLGLPRKPELNARARFYLGQVYFFQGQTRDALLEFLTARDFYFPQCEPWLDACYAKLEKTDLSDSGGREPAGHSGHGGHGTPWHLYSVAFVLPWALAHRALPAVRGIPIFFERHGRSSGMKIVVIGATGTIGKAVVDALGRHGHEVIGASRKSAIHVDIEDSASIRALFEKIEDVDAVVSCAGGAGWGALGSLTDDDFALSLRYKLMGQVNVVRAARDKVRDGGSITLTSGILATRPMPGSSAVSLVNAGLEGFVRAAGLEWQRGVRVNVVSPPWVKETLRARKMDDSNGLAAAEVAKAYIAAVEGQQNGEVLDAMRFA